MGRRRWLFNIEPGSIKGPRRSAFTGVYRLIIIMLLLLAAAAADTVELEIDSHMSTSQEFGGCCNFSPSSLSYV